MLDRVEKEICQRLSVRPRIAVHRQIGLALDVEGQIFLSQARPQTDGDLFGQFAEVEDTPLRMVPVGRHLLERLNQFGGMVEIGDQLR